jgi:hypothetical protein
LYKTLLDVVIAHQLVRPERNARFHHGFAAPQHRKYVGGTRGDDLDSPPTQGDLRQRRACPAQEAAMELRTRLNVLAAIISFAFLTAVVFGMF